MKKGYFFTLDAFIAMTIMIVCVILIFSIQTYKPYPMQSISFSEELMNTLSITKLYELQNDYYYQLLDGGDITQTDNTILEQIAWFAISGQQGIANSFALNITSNLVPRQFGCKLIIYNESSRFEINISETQVTQQEAKLLITSRRIIMGENEGVPWSPMLSEVRLWQ
jgi:hypothetical protein